MSAVSVDLFPAGVLRTPLEMQLTFTTSTTMGGIGVGNNEIKLTMPGFTRGSCMNLDDGSDELDQTLIKKAPAAQWNAYW